MIVVRIFNNNVLQAKKKGRDVIVQGKGIAFGKKPGEHISVPKDCRIYELNDAREYTQVQTLLDIVPAEYWDFVSQIQSYAEKELGKKFGTGFYFSMLDHFYSAVQRAKDGIVMADFFSADIKLYYKDLYDLAKKIVHMAEETFDVTFSRSENYFVATHLLDATLGTEETVSLNLAAEVVNCVVSSVKTYFEDTINEDSLAYMRFLTHVGLFAGRVILFNKQNTVSEGNNRYAAMTEQLEKMYPEHSKCIEKIEEDILEQFGYRLSGDERFYLLLHLTRISDSEE